MNAYYVSDTVLNTWNVPVNKQTEISQFNQELQLNKPGRIVLLLLCIISSSEELIFLYPKLQKVVREHEIGNLKNKIKKTFHQSPWRNTSASEREKKRTFLLNLRIIPRIQIYLTISLILRHKNA